MLTVVLCVAGLILGGMLAEEEGAAFGGALGVMFGLWIRERDRSVSLARRLDELRDEIETVKRQIETLRRRDEPVVSPPAAPARPSRPPAAQLAGFDPDALEAPPARLPAAAPAVIAAPAPAHTPAVPAPAPAAAAEPRAPQAAAAAPPPPPPSALDSALLGARELLLGGNTVVRVGMLVLLVGVTLLLKYAADHDMFPIELRMAGAAAIGLVLVVLGLRQRELRPGFARTLQGGGVAAMYLVVFFSFRTYQLIPALPAFALLAAVAASSAVLAVTQDALSLVVIGQVGGFLAPILASTGSGNHVALFSYYLVLNLAIFAIALVRAWRVLNVIGFLFTFGIGTAWGVMRYEPAQFASTEPFLIAFFLLYVAIPVIFAQRGEVRGFVDGSLVFGAPLCFLGLQLALVREIPFAMAYSSLGLAALYVGLARYLHRRAREALHALVEVFLALGVGFGTLAIPYGLDNAGLTSASWALEGAGLYWVGVRQQRWLSRAAGVVLQGMAGISLLIHVMDDASRAALPVLNTRMLAAALLCLSSLFIARHAYRHRERVLRWEAECLQLLIGWGLLFFLPLALQEIDAHVQPALQPGANLALLGATGLALELAGRRLAFLPGRYPAAVLVVLIAPYVLGWEASLGTHLFGQGGWFGWPIYFGSVLLTLYRLVPEAPAPFRYLHPIALWGAALFSGLELYRLVLDHAALSEDWAFAALGGGAIALLAWVTLASPTQRWPWSEQRALYLGLGACVLCAAILLWSLAFNLHARGLSAPLPYLPILNPVDLAQLLGCAAMLGWARAYRRSGHRDLLDDLLATVPAVLACALFVWWNAMLARSVHQFVGVPFSREALWRSVALQVALSISWSAIGLCLTVLASRRALRALWIVGAAVLGVVVCKLFVIDLARLSTIAKIGTFLVVGVLLLAVGYLAPVPPSARAPEPLPPAPDPVPPEPTPKTASESGP